MKEKRLKYIQNILIPCLLLSSLTGIITGILIFLFKYSASFVISVSETAYAYARTHPFAVPVLLICAAAVGICASLLLKHVPDARGGGIPTAIALVRGLVTFRWVRSIVFVFVSALMTYFAGIPLGNEGPSVQMGTAVGKGTVSLFAKKHPAWDRYIMTGGACAGFAAATGAPITGMLFAVEEAHRRISPMIFMAAAMSAVAGVASSYFLCGLTDTPFSLFHFNIIETMPMKYLWTAILTGAIAGLSAAGFTYLYRRIRGFIRVTLGKVPFVLKVAAIFLVSACVGIISASCIGSGHHLIEELFFGRHVTVMLIAVLAVRVLLLLAATNSDVTGGLFVPTLAFGAIIGALCGKGMTALGLLPEEYYPVVVIIGITAYLGASSRTPLMALAFSAEALGGLTNMIPIAAAVTISFIVIETLGIPSFTDTVVESKAETAYHGQEAYIVEAAIYAAADSFACGKDVRDLLLPPTCTILSIERDKNKHLPTSSIAAGDILHVYFKTYDPAATKESLEGIFGCQENTEYSKITFGKEGMIVPE